MATYVAVPDDYAGWNPTGRNFALIGAGVGAAGLLAWLSLNGRLGGWRPGAASDQLLLSGLVWLGGGGFFLMAVAAFGSVSLSLKARGTVDVSEAGVSRRFGSRTQTLRWEQIAGLVAMPQGGVTLVAVEGTPSLVIPRFLDDYRACIAEIKAHGVVAVPPSTLRKSARKMTWMGALRSFCVTFFCLQAMSLHESHRVRLASFVAGCSFLVWGMRDDWVGSEVTSSRWVSVVVIFGIVLGIVWRMFVTW